MTPTFEYFHLPVLKFLADGETRAKSEITDAAADALDLTAEDRAELTGSGSLPRYIDRAAWALTDLFQAGLLKRPSRGSYAITESGADLLNEAPEKIDRELLSRFAPFRDYQARSAKKDRPWLIAPGPQAILWDEFQKEGIAAIGWDSIGDLQDYQDREQIREELAEEDGSGSDFKNNTKALWQFSREMKEGDTIYAKGGVSKILGKGIITRAYRYDQERRENVHTIGVNWIDTRVLDFGSRRPLPTKTLTLIGNDRELLETIEAFYEKDELPDPSTATYSREELLTDLFMGSAQLETTLTLLRRKKNVILQGPPGVGKTYVARRLAYVLMGEKDPSRAPLVQFHQSYAYEDFVQGWRPDGKGGFELKNGIFYNLCREAAEDPDQDYFLIIDEINRGNLSKIFGELMMLIEADKRSPHFGLSLTYSPGSKNTFHVPKNVHLIGTMNTADRSLSLVDYALRRRFAFINLDPEFGSTNFAALLTKAGANSEMIEKIRTRLAALNNEILGDNRNLGPGFRIGHSFFCPTPDTTPADAWFHDVIDFEIAPLLREYWMENEDKAQSEIDRLKA